MKDEWHSCSGKEVDGPALQLNEPVRTGPASSRRSESSSDEAPLIEEKVKVRVGKLGEVPEGGIFKIGAHGRCKMISRKIYKLQKSGDLGAVIGYKIGFGKQQFKKKPAIVAKEVNLDMKEPGVSLWRQNWHAGTKGGVENVVGSAFLLEKSSVKPDLTLPHAHGEGKGLIKWRGEKRSS